VSARIVDKKKLRKEFGHVVMMNGSVAECTFSALVNVVIQDREMELNCIVADIVPGFDLLLGMDVVERFGCVQIGVNGGGVKFLDSGLLAAGPPAFIGIEDDDFSARFNDGAWSVNWKWVENAPVLENRVSEYRVPEPAREEYKNEVAE